jgi:hypothetical protein
VRCGPGRELTRLHHFSMLKKTPAGAEAEFTITVKEFATPKDGALVFFVQADKQTNVIEAKLANGRYEPEKTTWVKTVGPETTKRSFYSPASGIPGRFAF